MTDNKRLIIGITGATGAIYGKRLLELLRDTDIETHLVISKAAHITIRQELGLSAKQVEALADFCYPAGDIAAAISSGSFKGMGMIIAPCSIRTMSEIATGVTSTLLTRAADVALKERRKLVLMVREYPFHTGHLRTMANLSEMGAIIAPPVPAFYNMPAGIDDLVDHTLGRTLDLFDIEIDVVKRWKGLILKAF